MGIFMLISYALMGVFMLSYAVWFLFINKCSLESKLINELVGVEVKMRDSADIMASAFLHIIAYPLLAAAIGTFWFITIPTYIVYRIYKKKYLNQE